MAIYTKREFAELCKVGTNYLSVQIKRNKVKLTEDGKVNSDDPINKAYLEKIYGRMDFVPTLPAKKNEKPTISTKHTEAYQELLEDDEDITLDKLLANPDRSNLPYPELERIYKYLQGKQIEKRMEKEQLEIDKRRGVLVPAEPLKPIWLQHNQSIITEFKNTIDEIIRIIAKKKDLNMNEVAEIRGQLVASINQGMEKATLASMKAVKNIILEYSEKRGVGERK